MIKQNEQNSKRGLAETPCCFKSPSVTSFDKTLMHETTLSNLGNSGSGEAVPPLQSNNNNKFHTINQEKLKQRFPRKLAVDLQFSDIYYRVSTWSLQQLKSVKKEILHGVSGEFRSGELTAIMGPSGAGKSTLLNILAGYKLRGAEGTVMVNGRDRGKDYNKFSRLSCYIMQDDALRPALTVKEAMTFASHLKLGYLTSHKQKQKQIFDLLEMLGLDEHANTRTCSLSGGQRKRLSIALELISNPPVLFLDEPTTGLDSSSCSQCVSLLKLLAHQGRTVICTIHQPSALLFEMFDHLYALTEGSCIYQGTIKGLVPYLGDVGLNCPHYHNPADYLIEVAVGEYGANLNVLAAAAAKSFGERRKLPRIKDTTEEISTKAPYDSKKGIVNGQNPQYASLATSEDTSVEEMPISAPVSASLLAQFFLLYYRNIIVMCRNYMHFLIRIAAHVIIGLLFGYLYRGVGEKADTIFGNYVYLYGTTLFLVYTGKMAVTLSIPLEMNTLRREYFNRWYSLLPSFLAIILIEIPIQIVSAVMYVVVSYFLTGQPVEQHRIYLFFLICIVVTLTAQSAGFFIGVLTPFKIAVFLGPVIAVLLSTFGFNTFYRDIPSYFVWMYHISYFRAAFHSLVISMYGQNRTILPCDQLYCHYRYPEKFFDEMDITDFSTDENTIFVGSVGLLLHVCTIAVIWIKLNRR